MERPPEAVLAYLDRLEEAGFDLTALGAVLVDLRSDPKLSQEEREGLLKLLAQESYVWYVEALGAKKVDREKLQEAADAYRATLVSNGQPLERGAAIEHLLSLDLS